MKQVVPEAPQPKVKRCEISDPVSTTHSFVPVERYKNILHLINAHLQRYEPGGNVQTSRGPKFIDVI